MIDQKKRVLVCGTRFGQFYIEALKRLNTGYEIVGLLASGSARTQRCAAYYGLPVYTDVSALPEGIDLACVVVKSEVLGGQGTQIAKALMARGIDVLMEQPLHQSELAACAKCAQQSGVSFSVGNLYAQLPSTAHFIENAKILSATQPILYVNVDFATQVSYPVVTLLERLLPTLRPWISAEASGQAAPFQNLSATVGGIQVNFRAHNEVDKLDGDGYLHLLYRIVVGFPSGRLVLEDANGPVVWRPRMHIPDGPLMPAELSAVSEGSVVEAHWQPLTDIGDATYCTVFKAHWPTAIAEDIVQACSRSAAERKQALQKWLLCSQRWHTLMDALGYPGIVEKSPYAYTSPKVLKRYAATEQEGDITAAMRALDAACYTTMCFVLAKHLAVEEGVVTRAALLKALPHNPSFAPVIHRWFSELVKAGYLIETPSGLRFLGASSTESAFDAAWARARSLWTPAAGANDVLDYFYQNAVELEGILTGEVSATHLLFPQGDDRVAQALYSETAIARRLNDTVAAVISEKAGDALYRVMEIGGGTAATTRVVLPKVREQAVAYHFTDISDFFVNKARGTFKAVPQMTFDKFDVDAVDTPVGTPVDAIVAVGVLNNAKHLEKTLHWLNKKLEVGGHLIVVEAVGESMPMLISQAFMMSAAEDGRDTDNVTFRTLAKWLEAAETSGFELEQLTPSADDPLAVYNQKLFVWKKKGGAGV